jgi:hypothetical protein
LAANQRCISGAWAEISRNTGPDRQRQQTRHPQRLPARARRRQLGERNRQPQRGDNQQGQVNRCLAAESQAAEPMGIAVSGEQQGLIDQHRAVPHVGRAAQLRQGHSRNQRLDQEQQEAAGQNRRHEQRTPNGLGLEQCTVTRHPGRGLCVDHAPSSLAALAA